MAQDPGNEESAERPRGRLGTCGRHSSRNSPIDRAISLGAPAAQDRRDSMIPSLMATVSPQFSVTVRVELDARQEPLGELTSKIAECGGQLQGVDLLPGAFFALVAGTGSS